MDRIIASLSANWQSFDPLVAVLVLAAYFVIDSLFVHYTVSVNRRRASNAATTGAAMYMIAAFGIINYTSNYLYVAPLVIGAWLGTYFTVKREEKNDHVSEIPAKKKAM